MRQSTDFTNGLSIVGTSCIRWSYWTSYYARRENDFETIGDTRDDAVGEAYDKPAASSGAPYQVGESLTRWLLKKMFINIHPKLKEDTLDFLFRTKVCL